MTVPSFIPSSASLRRWATAGRWLAARPAAPYLIFVGVAVAAFGLLVPLFGFFWDDWPNAWFVHLMGPAGTLRAYAADRPFMGVVYLLTTPWLGVEPAPWHFFALGMRCLAAIVLWRLLIDLWPTEDLRNLSVALLFLIYPSFRQQAVAIIYGHFFLLLAIHLMSLRFTLRARHAHPRAWAWHGLAILGAAISMFALEYFVFLEVVRGFLIWRRPAPGRRRFDLKTWAPYLALNLAYLVWRVLIWQFPTYQPRLLTELTSRPEAALTALGTAMLDIFRVLIEIWGRALLPPSAGFGLRATLLWAALTVFVGAIIAAFLVLYRPSANVSRPAGSSRGSSREALALGVVAIVAAGAPAWITGLPVGLDPLWDRLTLPMTLGASLITGTGLAAIRRPYWLGPVLLAAAIGSGLGLQYRSGVSFARDWEEQRSIFHQLVWRIPGLRPGTVVVTNDAPLSYESDNSLTAPLNWLYGADGVGSEMPYLLYYISVREELGWPGFEPGLAIEQSYRATSFHGNTSQTLVVLFNSPGCLQVLDVVLHDSMPTVPEDLSRAVPLSRLDRIDTQAVPPADRLKDLFGTEPAGTWCEYFERADLMRQQRDWQAVASLGDQAFSIADRPNDASERLPFIEGYARVGRIMRAEELTREALDHNEAVRPMLCNTWRRLAEDNVAESRQIWRGLGCDADG